jgi:hypothetical protein
VAKFRTDVGDWENIVVIIFLKSIPINCFVEGGSYLGYGFFFFNNSKECEEGYFSIRDRLRKNCIMSCEFSSIESYGKQMEVAKDSYFGKVLSLIYKTTEMKKVPGT